MKRYLIIILLGISFTSYSQFYNTGETLKRGSFSLGVDAAYYDSDLALFLQGGAGLMSGVDFGIRFGIVPGDDYFGADLEWKLMGGKPDISLLTGGHVRGDIGLDAGLIISFPIKKSFDIYTGLDSDIIFGEDDASLLLWVPVGIELKMKSSIGLQMEGDIPATDGAFPIFGGGFAFYF